MFIVFEYLAYIGQLLLKLRAVKLAILVDWYSWQQLNNRQRKTAVNLLIHFLKGTINSSVWWKFQVFDPCTLKWWAFEIFAKMNGKVILLTVFAKFGEYQSNFLTEMHNFS